MYYDDYDFYDESVNSELDEFVENIKSKAKKEFLDKLDKLEKENQELQEIKRNYDAKIHQLENEYENKKWELENEYKEKERNLYKRPIEEIYPLVSKMYYSASIKYDYIPKCDKCNDDREFVFIDPLNQKHTFPCSCKKTEFVGYEVREKQVKFISEISIRNGRPCLWVTFSKPMDSDYISGNFFDRDMIVSKDKVDDLIANYKKLTKINKYSPTDYYFENKEDCKLFISFLNNNFDKVKKD